MTTMYPNPNYKVHREALLAVVNGPFIPDWEFQTIFGWTRSEVESVAASFSPDTPVVGEVAAMLRVSIGNLLWYPHNQESIWNNWISVTPSELETVFSRLKASRED